MSSDIVSTIELQESNVSTISEETTSLSILDATLSVNRTNDHSTYVETVRVSDSADTQFGPRFIAENLTIVFPNSEQLFHNSNIDTNNILQNIIPIQKSQQLNWLALLFISLICLCVFVLYFSSLNIPLDISSSNQLDMEMIITTEYIILSETETTKVFKGSLPTLSNVTLPSTTVKISQKEIVSSIDIVHPEIFARETHLKSESRTEKIISATDNVYKEISLVNNSAFSNVILKYPVLKSQCTTVCIPFQRVDLVVIHISQQLTSFLDYDYKMWWETHTDYSSPYYNFVIARGMIFVGSGWSCSFQEESFSIQIVPQKEEWKYKLTARQMYLFMVLINVGRQCGKISATFKLDLDHRLLGSSIDDTSWFQDLVNASRYDRYYIESEDRFMSDSKLLRETCK